MSRPHFHRNRRAIQYSMLAAMLIRQRGGPMKYILAVDQGTT
jgi:hypothetical protein